MKLVQNLSPCSSCVHAIIDFINEWKESKLKFSWQIQFVAVYEHYTKSNIEALKKLWKTDGVVLDLIKGENNNYWEEFLHTYVNVNPDEKTELLGRARSNKRTLNEQRGKEIFEGVKTSGKLKAIEQYSYRTKQILVCIYISHRRLPFENMMHSAPRRSYFRY